MQLRDSSVDDTYFTTSNEAILIYVFIAVDPKNWPEFKLIPTHLLLYLNPSCISKSCGYNTFIGSSYIMSFCNIIEHRDSTANSQLSS